MSSLSARPDQHLVSLVLQSKQALQNGEQLCSRANVLSNASVQAAVIVLALDAKVRWITEAVLEQLKAAASVAKSIQDKRARLGKQVQEWDLVRIKHSDALDGVLESLGSQLVPPEFHQMTSDSSLFGSQHSEDEIETTKPVAATSPLRSPSSTVRNVQKEKAYTERSTWKTLRDFVDDQAIEDVLEIVENDRTALDDTLGKTDDYPEILSRTIGNIQDSLPDIPPLLPTENMLNEQDATITTMASHLESLAAHYDQMSSALSDSEAGEAFSEEDLQEMNRDTKELPSIMSELEEAFTSINETHEFFTAAQDTGQKHLGQLSHTMDDLDELADILTEMLETQDSVETECETQLNGLQQHLLTLEHLHERFLSYQTAFSKLILEIARRRQYREAAENIVHGMMAQLGAMTEEENQVRDHFNAEHGAHLPEDICLCIRNPPTKWDVVPWQGEAEEFLPDLPNDLIAAAREKIGKPEANGTESI